MNASTNCNYCGILIYMLQIAVIKPNKITFENITFDDVKSSKFVELLKPAIDIVNIDASSNDETMKNMIPYIGASADETRRTYKCYENKTQSVYLIYVASDEQSLELPETNRIGRFLSEGHEPVVGSCVILNTDVSKNCDITFDNVIEIFRSRLVHTAIVLHTDGTISETEFNRLPIERTHMNENNCRCYQLEFLNKILCVFIEPVPQNGSVNKMATILCKRARIHGDIIVGMLTKYPTVEVIDIDADVFRKILCVRSNTSSTANDKFSEEALHNNFYNILDKYAHDFNNTVIETIPDDVMHGPAMNATLQ